MYSTMMKNKKHLEQFSEANLNYIGSITIAKEILDKPRPYLMKKYKL